MTPGSNDLVNHLEDHLGLIARGWSTDEEGQRLPFQVVQFSGDVAGGVAYSTLGLSGQPLQSRVSPRKIYQELMLIIPQRIDGRRAAALVHQVGLEALSSGQALLRGDVIGPRGQIFEGSQMEAFYASVPVYLPEDFASVRTELGEIIFSWLVPITHSEAHFAIANGWNAFEDRLVEADPDLVDVDRLPIV